MERRRQPPTKVPVRFCRILIDKLSPLNIFQPKKWIRIKILSMGDAGTGKSCLIKRYCEDKVPPPSATPAAPRLI
jgi:hypothetical protein